MGDIFTDIYEKNIWKSSVSRSGTGSDNIQTSQIKEAIVRLVKKYNINTFFDIPCGDFVWFQHIVHEIPKYIGGDIVEKIIVRNNETFGNNFIKFDLIKDKIPADIDVLFCRDCLVHLPLHSILTILENIKQSNVKYLLMTTFINRDFTDCVMGGWRPISFLNAPFNFPKPLELIAENCSEFFPRYVDKSLGFWNVSDIPTFIPRKIFRFWHSSEIPADLQHEIDIIKKENPEFEHIIYDQTLCEEFLKEHFDVRVWKAYDKLLPMAYKTDLWRLCVLYIYGGIYLDISFKSVNNFKFIELISQEHFSREVLLHPYNNDPYKGVSNGIIVALPKNKKLLQCIEKIVEQVETNFYGQGVYDITGAVCFGSFFSIDEKKSFHLSRVMMRNTFNGYSFNNRNILERIQSYDKNRKEGTYAGVPAAQTYLDDWFRRRVYKI